MLADSTKSMTSKLHYPLRSHFPSNNLTMSTGNTYVYIGLNLEIQIVNFQTRFSSYLHLLLKYSCSIYFSSGKYFNVLTHMPIHIPKYALPVQLQKFNNSTRRSPMPKHISKNPIKMCAIARFLAILATLAEGSAMLALLALVLSLRIFCTNKELLT